jgi:hypothetical protein
MKWITKWHQNFEVKIKKPFPPNLVEGAGKTKPYCGVHLKRLWLKDS